MGDSGPTIAEALDEVSNEDAPWDYFDSDSYFWHNYGHLRADDKQIIDIVADFFVHCFDRDRPRKLANAIDVGSGTNLYPAMTMLPFASRVTLFERSPANRQWLIDALNEPQGSWDEFWKAVAAGRPTYQRIRKPLEVLAMRAWVTKGNVFALGADDRYDLGTMFFVAESITTRDDEFRRATLNFVDSLKPGSPFAAAFMCRSEGYFVGSTFFPAHSIDITDVEMCLADIARISQIEKVASEDLRAGYSGMIVATGWKR